MLNQKLLSLTHRLLPLIPAKWRLSVLARAHSFAGWEPEVGWIDKIGPCQGMAIDVGANQGFYSLALARHYSKVVAFEPNKSIAAPLIDASLPDVEVIHAGVSSKAGAATLFIPSAKGVALPGWASLDKHNCPGATAFEQQEIRLCTLDSFDFQNVGFIKIDVEGHEREVLLGASALIQRDHPHLLVEVKEQNLSEVCTMLAGWGYTETTLPSLGGPSGSPENHIFLPR